jgi:hypothetical protein
LHILNYLYVFHQGLLQHMDWLEILHKHMLMNVTIPFVASAFIPCFISSKAQIILHNQFPRRQSVSLITGESSPALFINLYLWDWTFLINQVKSKCWGFGCSQALSPRSYTHTQLSFPPLCLFFNFPPSEIPTCYLSCK